MCRAVRSGSGRAEAGTVRLAIPCCFVFVRSLTLSRAPTAEGAYWNDVAEACKADRLPPLAPDAFEAMMREGMAREQAAAGTGIRFTNGKDATDICIPQYREALPNPLPPPRLASPLTPHPRPCRGSGTARPLRGS